MGDDNSSISFNSTRKQIESLNFNIDGQEYHGQRNQEEKHSFIACEAENGQKIDVYILEDCSEQEWNVIQAASSHKFSHLGFLGRNVNHAELRVFDIFRPVNLEDYCTVEEMLFEKQQLNMNKRMYISMSMAAAGAELEEYLMTRDISRIDISSIYIHKTTGYVYIDLEKLLSETDGFDRKKYRNSEEYKQMKFNGLLPPECYENPEADISVLAILRHMMAVLIFRCLTAADPFDGAQTLVKYPYRTEAVLSKIYGYDAAYVCAKDSVNPVNNYIGRNAAILRMISPGLKNIFYTAFVEAMKDPEKRPTMRQWLKNQMNIFNSWIISPRFGWIVPDYSDPVSSKNIVGPDMQFIRTANNSLIPVADGRSLFQYMFEDQIVPFKEQIIARLKVQDGRIQIVYEDPGRQPGMVTQSLFQINGYNCSLEKQPWLNVQDDKASLDNQD